MDLEDHFNFLSGLDKIEWEKDLKCCDMKDNYKNYNC